MATSQASWSGSLNFFCNLEIELIEIIDSCKFWHVKIFLEKFSKQSRKKYQLFLSFVSYPVISARYPLISAYIPSFTSLCEVSGYERIWSGYERIFDSFVFLKIVSTKTQKYQELPSIMKIWLIQCLEKRVFFPVNELWSSTNLYQILKPNV